MSIRLKLLIFSIINILINIEPTNTVKFISRLLKVLNFKDDVLVSIKHIIKEIISISIARNMMICLSPRYKAKSPQE